MTKKVLLEVLEEPTTQKDITDNFTIYIKKKNALYPIQVHKDLALEIPAWSIFVILDPAAQNELSAVQQLAPE